MFNNIFPSTPNNLVQNLNVIVPETPDQVQVQPHTPIANLSSLYQQSQIPHTQNASNKLKLIINLVPQNFDTNNLQSLLNCKIVNPIRNHNTITFCVDDLHTFNTIVDRKFYIDPNNYIKIKSNNGKFGRFLKFEDQVGDVKENKDEDEEENEQEDKEEYNNDNDNNHIELNQPARKRRKINEMNEMNEMKEK